MPDSERERRLEELHSAALQRDASERDEFLRQACGGDLELRRAVESLHHRLQWIIFIDDRSRFFIDGWGYGGSIGEVGFGGCHSCKIVSSQGRQGASRMMRAASVIY